MRPLGRCCRWGACALGFGRLITALLFAGGCLLAQAAWAADSGGEAEVEQLRGLSIEELANVEVSSVSRRPESLAEAPAAAYVITREEIVRYGARTLPEILRLAPNLFVAQVNANSWVITARGLSGNPANQAFSNKLLVLIDGRTVYTPLFSGVYWDMQDVLTSDIDHVEVISGPGATLWGANAVNGVINIITRRSGETQGLSLGAALGDQERLAAVRFGGSLGANASYRLYGRGYRSDNTLAAGGADAGDRWNRVLGGFRVDWSPSAHDAVTFHGDAFNGSGKTSGAMSGGNLLARWNRAADDGSGFQVQAYADRAQRGHDLTGGLPLTVNTYDLEVLRNFTLGGRHDIVLGGGIRKANYRLVTAGGLSFSPARGALDLSNVFAQDTVSLAPTLKMIVGLKMEDDSYTGWTALPNVRVSWTPSPRAMAWAAVSRAIRAPTPFDRDVVETVAGQVFLTGNKVFRSERLTAYEAGVRLQPTERTSFSASAYYNDYDRLRSVEITPVTFLPIMWGNGIRGRTYGLETWGKYQAAPWWRLSGSVNLMSSKFRFRPGSSGLLGLGQVGDDPKVQAQLESSIDLGPVVTWAAAFRYQGKLPDPRVPAYVELNSRLAWDITPELQVALIGRNLLHKHHQEFAPQSNPVPRTGMAELRWRF
jgi:iron complex outermembrane receptor protein